ncbi:DUF2066 domain-containing protein, partial [Rhizobiaceae sp. 2RAB30]
AGGMPADMRNSLAAAADRAGLPISLPARPASVEAASLGASAKTDGGDVGLKGSMTWRNDALGWVCDWTLASEDKTYRWRDTGVGFDDAFRHAMRGAAQVLSGHGQPE